MRERNQRPSLMDRRSDFMKSVPQSSSLEETLSYVLEERANVLARETGCVQRQVKFSGATLLQTVVFGWLQHPDASLESLASTAEIRAVSVTDTAIKLHVRWDLKRGRLWGPALTAGRASDHTSPWADEALPPKSLYCSDLGYFHLGRLAGRQRAKVYAASALASRHGAFQRAGEAAE